MIDNSTHKLNRTQKGKQHKIQ